MAESLMAGGAIQKRAALVAAQHYFPDEAEKKAGSIERQLRARRKRNGQ
ncbi:hypothetical protein [uncultured Thiodictyon sp.]|nr:hypothetical protein [uncultured Thiodictyon sp.]